MKRHLTHSNEAFAGTKTMRRIALVLAFFSMISAFSQAAAFADSDGGAASPPKQTVFTPTRVTPSAEMVPARGIDAALDVKGDDAMFRFSFPVKVPAWFLWQQATDCQAYVKSITLVKRCEYFVRDGKPAVLIEAVVLGRTYSVVVGIERQFRRGHGKIKFESHNVVPTPASGALQVEPEGEGNARLSFEAKMPRDPNIPEFMWKLGVAAVIHASAARIQSTVEGEYRTVKENKDLAPRIQLRSPAPPAPGGGTPPPGVPTPPAVAPNSGPAVTPPLQPSPPAPPAREAP